MMLGAVLASLALIVVNGVFVATEFGLLVSMRTRLEPLAAEGRIGARQALKAMSALGPMLAGTQLGITIASLVLGSVAEPAVGEVVERLGERIGLPRGVVAVVAVALALAVVVFLHLLIGEIRQTAAGVAAGQHNIAEQQRHLSRCEIRRGKQEFDRLAVHQPDGSVSAEPKTNSPVSTGEGFQTVLTDEVREVGDPVQLGQVQTPGVAGMQRLNHDLDPKRAGAREAR